ncbi:MAG: histidine kinase dimerization/phospho-acceptor domain-containing protein, partial [Candidatus Competibacterales bacterium]
MKSWLRLWLWPQSVWGQTALLIVAVLLISQLISILLLRQFTSAPLAEQVAQALSLQAKLLAELRARPGGAGAAPQPRIHPASGDVHLETLVAPFGFHLSSKPPATAGPLPGLPFFAILSAELAGSPLIGEMRLGVARRPSLPQTPPEGVLWIELLATGDPPLWLGQPIPPLARRGLQFAGGWLLLVSVLVGVVALGVARYLQRPLRDLHQAAAALVRGDIPPALSRGPREIRAVGGALRSAAEALAHQRRERELMLAGVSHDLRTPLARLRIAVEYLDEENPLQGALKGGMVADIDDIDHLVDQFIAYERHGSDEDPILDDLNAAVEAVAQRLARGE